MLHINIGDIIHGYDIKILKLAIWNHWIFGKNKSVMELLYLYQNVCGKDGLLKLARFEWEDEVHTSAVYSYDDLVFSFKQQYFASLYGMRSDWDLKRVQKHSWRFVGRMRDLLQQLEILA